MPRFTVIFLICFLFLFDIFMESHVKAQENSSSPPTTRKKHTTDQKDNKRKKWNSMISSSPIQNSFINQQNLDPTSILDYLQSTRNHILTKVYNMQRQYDKLPPKVKFTAGTVTGFASTKMVLGTAFKMIKIVGAFYLITEVLNSVGVLDDEIPFPEEGRQWMRKARDELVHTIQWGREALHKRIHVQTFRACVEKDKMTTVGFVTGMFLSLAT